MLKWHCMCECEGFFWGAMAGIGVRWMMMTLTSITEIWVQNCALVQLLMDQLFFFFVDLDLSSAVHIVN